MRLQFRLRSWHKWLSLLLGVQALIWCVSGLYMVAVDIDFIHGDPLVRNQRPAVPEDLQLLPVAKLLDEYGGLYSARLKALPGVESPVYELGAPDGPVTINAVTGERLSPLPRSLIEQLARSYYAGAGAIARAELIDHVPVEIRGRPPKLWRVDFDDWLHTSFYLDADTGALVTRRHRFWRIFDAFWMLHIMDYGYERDDVNNSLLRVTAAAGVLFGVTGVWLLYYSFRRRPVWNAESPQ